ncbi:unnamed protein product [Brassica oleracea var. botrytis]|uniref:NYN domain-containing protein n=1 Tax=Brassica oleracea TaxID=3712 RepID=A0A3P6CHG9_BRAOL|nr:unnamed protein product [Brassica oleracea]
MGEYKIGDFSKPITPVEGAKTGVFWNVEDCPFPVGFSPDMIYHKIESALSEWCNVGNMSMWAYVDEEKGHWSGKGDKLLRDDRLLHDILLWQMDSPVDHPDPANLIVVSDKVRDHTYLFETLGCWNTRYYNVMLVTPTNQPLTPDWPASLLEEGAYCFGKET